MAVLLVLSALPASAEPMEEELFEEELIEEELARKPAGWQSCASGRKERANFCGKTAGSGVFAGGDGLYSVLTEGL